jgi:hypothetical protein
VAWRANVLIGMDVAHPEPDLVGLSTEIKSRRFFVS